MQTSTQINLRDHNVCVLLSQTKKLLEFFHKICCECFAVGQTVLRNCKVQFDIRSSDVEAPRAALDFGFSADIESYSIFKICKSS
jgi:hypothetical protein